MECCFTIHFSFYSIHGWSFVSFACVALTIYTLTRESCEMKRDRVESIWNWKCFDTFLADQMTKSFLMCAPKSQKKRKKQLKTRKRHSRGKRKEKYVDDEENRLLRENKTKEKTRSKWIFTPSVQVHECGYACRVDAHFHSVRFCARSISSFLVRALSLFLLYCLRNAQNFLSSQCVRKMSVFCVCLCECHCLQMPSENVCEALNALVFLCRPEHCNVRFQKPRKTREEKSKKTANKKWNEAK